LGRLVPANEELFKAFGAGNDYNKCVTVRSPSQDRYYPSIPPSSEGPECDTTDTTINNIKIKKHYRKKLPHDFFSFIRVNRFLNYEHEPSLNLLVNLID
jgi:hypothetical protein